MDSLTDLNDFLDAPLAGDTGSGDSPSSLPKFIPVVEIAEGEIDPRYTRLSYSTEALLHSCPRKFQLKCLEAERVQDASTSVTFAFGSTVGMGVAEFMVSRDLEATIFKMFLEWDVDYLAENKQQKKSFPHAVIAIELFKSQLEDGAHSEYEVAEYNGKPAVELSFSVSFPGELAEFTYRGYLDLVLRNIMTGQAGVMENKTNSGTWVNHHMYKNSEQALGYSIILDQIEPGVAAYDVMYYIFMTKLGRYEQFDFPKSHQQRALWLRDRMWNISLVEKLVKEEGNYGMWPICSQGCVSFGRPCEYMDICQLPTESLMAKLKETQLVDRDRKTGEIAEYDFELTLKELL